MKRSLLVFLTLLGLLSVLSAQDISMSKTDHYKKAWKEVQAFESKGLARDALKACEDILSHAKAEKNSVQHVKALLHVLRYSMPLNERADSLNIARIKQEIVALGLPHHGTSASFSPSLGLLESVLADMYWSYYRQNRWRIQERTAVDVKPDDFQTWDVKTLMQEAAAHYLASLEHSAALQKLDIDDFEELLVRGKESKRYRPTLYDLLAHRCLDFFSNTETNLSEPTYRFELPLDQGLLSAERFVKLDFNTRDKHSRDLQATKLYQDILRFHLQSNNSYALVDADLKPPCLCQGKRHRRGNRKALCGSPT